jgi:hypothetical protein
VVPCLLGENGTFNGIIFSFLSRNKNEEEKYGKYMEKKKKSGLGEGCG